MEDSKREPRRRHSVELKKQVLAECTVPGASVAKVALAHGLNANLVHKWRRLRDASSGAMRHTRQSTFIPVTMASAPTVQTSAGDIQLQLRRGATALTITWPVAAAAECAIWMRELLR